MTSIIIGRYARLTLAGLAVVGIAAGCEKFLPDSSTSGGAAATQPGPYAVPPGRPNLVIMLIDTLRADRLGCYGYKGKTSPRIDGLARGGILFEAASAPAPWTLPSVVSLMTSTFACEHGVLTNGQYLDAKFDPLAARLKRAGYQTASMWANPFAGPTSGMDRGFDSSRRHERTGAAEVDAWLTTLDPNRPFFLYVHNVEPHEPFRVPEEFIVPAGSVSHEDRQRIQEEMGTYRRLTRVDSDAAQPLGTTDNAAEQRGALDALDADRDKFNILYDASVRWADSLVGEVVDTLTQRGLWKKTIFVLVADHGEEIGDHGGWEHDQSVYEELLRVPLIFHLRRPTSVQRVADPVSLIDLPPTLADLLRVPALAADTRGVSLAGLIRAPGHGRVLPRQPELRTVALRHNVKKFYKPYKEGRGDLNLAARLGQWKGIWNVELERLELYDLKLDPQERRDRGWSEPLLARRMEEFLRAAYAKCTDGGQAPQRSLTDEQRKQLKSLGYLGGDEQPAPRP